MYKDNKNAFTLIELLAVIAILAIVMIIAVPTVLNTIATAKKGAFKDSVLAILKDAETKILESYTLGNDIKLPLSNEYVVIDVNSLDFENKNDYKGYVLVTKEGDSFNFYPYIKQKEYCITGVSKSNISTSDIVDIKNCTIDSNIGDKYIKDNKLSNTVNGTPYKFVGQILSNGKELSFDGTNTIALTGIPVNITAGAKNTVEFWMYWDGTNNVMPFGFQSYELLFRDTYFGFNTSNNDMLGFSSNSLKSKWVHVAAVFYNGLPTNSTNKIYINGDLQTISTLIGNQVSRIITGKMNISGYPDLTIYRFTGQIRSLRVWNTEITEAQIRDNMFSIINDSPNLLYSSDR